MYDAWRGVFERKECGSVLLYPKSDRLYRITHFMEECAATFPKNWQVAQLSLQSINSEENDEFMRYFRSNAKEKHTHYCYLLSDGEWLLTTAPNVLPVLNQLFHQLKNISFLVFFETNVLDPMFDTLVSQCMPLLQNILYRPFYKKEEILHFLTHMSRLHTFDITESHLKEIWIHCTGNMWLATEAWRHLTSTNTLSFNHPSFQFRLDAIWRGFSENEKQKLILSSKHHLFTEEELSDQASRHLVKLGILNDEGGRLGISVPVFEDYVKKMHAQSYHIRIKGTKIHINNLPVSLFLSKREENLLYRMFSDPARTVGRETVSELLWGRGASPTDWAIDQAITRLRKKILKILPVEVLHIQTVKGKGYALKTENV